jgi:hypothetical protein
MTTATQRFIEKAIEGGWKSDEPHIAGGAYENGDFFGGHAHYKFRLKEGHAAALKRIAIESIVLDPAAWQAVGKVSGWAGRQVTTTGQDHYDGELRIGVEVQSQWSVYMHRMIDALAEGKSIESYLETIV